MLAIFSYDFMIRAFIAGTIIGIIAPLIGSFLVVRRYSLLADTLAHVSLTGVAIGLLLKTNPIVSAIITSVIAAIGIEKLRTDRKLYGESVLALFLTGSLALATVLLSLARGFTVNLLSYLFGSIATVTVNDLWLIGILGAIICISIVVLYKELFFISLDEELAVTSGLPVKALNLILIILAALAVTLSIRIVGVLLIGALMVIPVITAIQYGKSFYQTVMLSILFSLISVIAGLFISFYLDLASGGTIVVLALIIFVLSLIGNRTN
jgi:zinc transport system permease protein